MKTRTCLAGPSQRSVHRLLTPLLAVAVITLLGGDSGFITSSAEAGPVVIDGTDANDHGSENGVVNIEGWLYMQKVLENLAPQVGNGNKILVDLGTAEDDDARNAIDSAFTKSTLPGAGWTIAHFVTADDISNYFGGGTVSGAALTNTGIIYISTQSNTSGDLEDDQIAAINANASVIADFVGGAGNPLAGGGLFAMGENGTGAYGWLSSLIPGITVLPGGDSTAITLTPTGEAAFPGLTSSDLSAGPWHNDFTGNFGSLQVLATAPRPGDQGEIRSVILGGGAATVLSEISVTPQIATNAVGTSHTVCASIITVANGVTNIFSDATVFFSVTNGPNAGVSGQSVTDTNGKACFTYTGTGGPGIDTIEAVFIENESQTHKGIAIKVWIDQSSCPLGCANVTVCNDTGQCGAVVNYPPPTNANQCTVVCDPPAGSFFPKGTTTVTCGVISLPQVQVRVPKGVFFGSSCSFAVTVTDCEAPKISCPSNLTVCNDNGQCSAVVNYQVTASDNCPGVSVVCSPASGSAFPGGVTQVNCTATDTSGNTASCGFNVTVNDCEAPVASCSRAASVAGVGDLTFDLNRDRKKVRRNDRNKDRPAFVTAAPTDEDFDKDDRREEGELFQLIATDNCDAHPRIFLLDSCGTFIAGPFASGNIVRILHTGGRPNQKPGTRGVTAVIHLKCNPLVRAIDASGNVSIRHGCATSLGNSSSNQKK